ncbi:hypothetical protein [Nitratireductor sp. StC3]|uniref:hypothetical protein n=1 Tax=Nitratireductor sp. StC3 TaxID=2126741 RepID=UPI000D0CAD0D|nr:hypothetical protein [Nitratireductor sp. StC3]PSM16292.1 hypothetical protein C7T96_20850 [Nitratireductor sp. StC3]
MARKAFFAAFVIDEEAYTPEPGPVDCHLVVADLAQSSFGEQSGVSNFIVWESAEHMIADHRQRGPITVDYLVGDESDQGICDDSGTDLNVSKVAVSPSTIGPSFRDHLSPTMRETLAFEYFEVRPCIEADHQVRSYRVEDEFTDDLARAQKSGREFRAFWSLYGVDRGATMAIGDFVSKDAAHEVMNAILAIPAAVCNAIKTENLTQAQNNTDVDMTARSVADWLDDMINQSSNNQRI